MTAASRKRLFAEYLLLGLGLGMMDPWLGVLASSLGVKSGVATAVTVNVVLPLAAVALGFAHGRVAVAMMGAMAMTFGLMVGLAFQYSRGQPDWSPAALMAAVPPVLVAATLGYAVLGALAALAGRASAEEKRCQEPLMPGLSSLNLPLGRASDAGPVYPE